MKPAHHFNARRLRLLGVIAAAVSIAAVVYTHPATRSRTVATGNSPAPASLASLRPDWARSRKNTPQPTLGPTEFKSPLSASAYDLLHRPMHDPEAQTAWEAFVTWLEDEDAPRDQRLADLETMLRSIGTPESLELVLQRLRTSFPAFPEAARWLAALARVSDTPDQKSALAEALVLASSDSTSEAFAEARELAAHYFAQELDPAANPETLRSLLGYVPEVFEHPTEATNLLLRLSGVAEKNPALTSALTMAWTALALRTEEGQVGIAPLLLGHYLATGMTQEAQEFLVSEVNTTSEEVNPELRPLLREVLEKSRPKPDIDDSFSQWVQAMAKVDGMPTDGSVLGSFLASSNAPLEKAAILHSNPQSLTEASLLWPDSEQLLRTELGNALQLANDPRSEGLLQLAWKALDRRVAEPLIGE